MSYLKEQPPSEEKLPWQEIDVAKLDSRLVKAFEEFHTLPPGGAKFKAQKKINELAEADEIYPHLEPHVLFEALLASYEASKAAMSRDEGVVAGEKNTGNPPGYDPKSDPEVLGAVAMTQFAYGESGDQARARYFELMKEKGISEEEARRLLPELNALHYPGAHQSEAK